jgi:ABC-type multidrug transport system fused ATPase/permease subunit
VLHNLNFKIRPGEKVGVIGRTGSGKSTLALSFFRFVEASKGGITVDGIDIAKVGLTDLRSRLTIIPRMFPPPFAIQLSSFGAAEDPTILSGTIRSTLDSFGEYTDLEIVSCPTSRTAFSS